MANVTVLIRFLFYKSESSSFMSKLTFKKCNWGHAMPQRLGNGIVTPLSLNKLSRVHFTWVRVKSFSTSFHF